MPALSALKRIPRIPRFTRLPLGVEITLLLIIKISLLTVLAKTFFAHPEAKHMRMPVERVEQRMLAPASGNPVASPAPSQPNVTPSTLEVTHGSDR
jgi:hypothetical protein